MILSLYLLSMAAAFLLQWGHLFAFLTRINGTEKDNWLEDNRKSSMYLALGVCWFWPISLAAWYITNAIDGDPVFAWRWPVAKVEDNDSDEEPPTFI